MARTKIHLFKSITHDLFKVTFLYIKYLQIDNKEGEKYYGLLIKAELLKLEE